jgi:hypothetical protein
MQKVGLPAIPNIYWYGPKDLVRWAKWLNDHPQVKTAAINLQTLRTQNDWDTTSELKQFLALLNHDIQFVVDGPSIPGRIDKINDIFPNVAFTNKFSSAMAANGMQLNQELGKIIRTYSSIPKNYIFQNNTNLYKKLTLKTGILSNVAGCHNNTSA